MGVAIRKQSEVDSATKAGRVATVRDLSEVANANGAALYALIDEAAAPGFDRWRLLAASRLRVDRLFDGTPEAGFENESPLVVCLDFNDENFRLVSQRLAEADSVHSHVHWITSAVPRERLLAHLRYLLRGCLDTGDEVLVRYFDRSILPWIDRALSPAQRSVFFGPCRSWQCFDRGTLVAFGVDTRVEHPEILPEEPIQYDERQQKRIAMAALPDSIVPILQAELSDRLLEFSAGDLRERVATQVEAACALGILDWPSMIHFQLIAFGLNESFYRDSLIATQLPRISDDGVSFKQVVEEIAIEEWNRIREHGPTIAVQSYR